MRVEAFHLRLYRVPPAEGGSTLQPQVKLIILDGSLGSGSKQNHTGWVRKKTLMVTADNNLGGFSAIVTAFIPLSGRGANFDCRYVALEPVWWGVHLNALLVKHFVDAL